MLAAASIVGLVLIPLAFTSNKVDDPQPMNLWPREAPGETGKLLAELDTRNSAGGIAMVTNVSVPTLTVFKPDPAVDIHTAVIVCPGGGYQGLAYDYEGSDICKWLNTLGVTGVLLKYRVPALGQECPDMRRLCKMRSERLRPLEPIPISGRSIRRWLEF